ARATPASRRSVAGWALVLGSPSYDQTTDANRHEGEDHHRDTEQAHGDGVARGGDHGSDHRDADHRETPALHQPARRDDAHELEEPDKHGEKEAEPEGEDHQPDQRHIAVDRIDLIDVVTGPGNEPVQGLPD